MEIDSPAAIFVEVTDQGLQLVLGRLEAESSQSHLQLLCLNGTRTASIEQIECLLDLLLLSLTELLLVGVLLLLDLLVSLAFAGPILLLLRVLIALLRCLPCILNETVGLPFYLFEI